MAPNEIEEIDATIKWAEELNEIGKRVEKIKATTKWVKEQSSRGTEGRSETVIEADKNLINLKQEYKKLVWNYNKKYQKQERFKPKRLQRIKFDDEGERKDWGELDKNMLEWVTYMFFTYHFEGLVDIPPYWRNYL